MNNKALPLSAAATLTGAALVFSASFHGPASSDTARAERVPVTQSAVLPLVNQVTPTASRLVPSYTLSPARRGRATIVPRRSASTSLSPIRDVAAAVAGATLTEWDVGEELRHPLAWHESSGTLFFVRGYSEPHLIVRLDPTTGGLTEWPVPGEGLFRIFVDSATGHVFFADFRQTVRRLDPATNQVTEWTFPVTEHDPDGQIHTAGMDTDSVGNLWIMGYHNHTVYRLNLSSNVLTAYPIPHDDPQNPDILVDDEDNVIWQAQETNTMNVLFPKTNLYKEWPLPSFKRHLFGIGTGNPASPNLGNAHEIIFGAPAVNKVVRLNTETNVVTEWPEWDTHHDQGYDQSYVAVGHNKNRIYLTDSATGRIGMINTRTNRLTEWSLPQDGYRGPTSLVIDQSNRLFFTEEGASRIGVLDLSELAQQEGDSP